MLSQCISGKEVKWSRYRPGMAQRVGRGIALLFHDTRRGWVVSSTPRPHFTPGKEPVPILQEAGWAPGPVWTGGKSRPLQNSIPDRPAGSQSLYRQSYPDHVYQVSNTNRYCARQCNVCAKMILELMCLLTLERNVSRRHKLYRVILSLEAPNYCL